MAESDNTSDILNSTLENTRAMIKREEERLERWKNTPLENLATQDDVAETRRQLKEAIRQLEVALETGAGMRRVAEKETDPKHRQSIIDGCAVNEQRAVLFRDDAQAKHRRAIVEARWADERRARLAREKRARLASAEEGAGGDDDGADYRPASAFPVALQNRLRAAAQPKRKTKRVRSKKMDGITLYSAADARRWWPRDTEKI